jgi:hypothetical protein
MDTLTLALCYLIPIVSVFTAMGFAAHCLRDVAGEKFDYLIGLFCDHE